MSEKPRVVFCGDPKVGKTTLIQKYQGIQSATSPTIICDESELPLRTSGGKSVRAAVWDIAGNMQLSELMPLYVRDATVCVLVFAIDDEMSLAHVAGWRERVHNIVGDSVCFIIAANKIDLRADGASSLAAEQDCLICETSALTGYGVERLFSAVADACVGRKIKPIRAVIQVEPAPQSSCRPSCLR
jgi:small GTP-binding protein